MGFAKTQQYTTDDIYALPDEKRSEFIDGQIYDMAPAQREKHTFKQKHLKVCLFILHELRSPGIR